MLLPPLPTTMASCGVDKVPFVAFVVCVRSPPPPSSLSQMPLFTSLLPSLISTVTHGERAQLLQPHKKKDGAMCLYLCGQADDEILTSRAKELRELLAKKAWWLGARILFYPAGTTYVDAVSGAAQAAHADGARYIHHTYDDVQYLDGAGWLSTALETLRNRSYVGAVTPRVLPSAASAGGAALGGVPHGRPVVVARRHLDMFESLYPSQLADDSQALEFWMKSVYADDGATPSSSSLSSSSASRGATRRAMHHAAAAITSGAGTAAATMAALVECGRRVVATPPLNNGTAALPAPRACTVSLNARGGGGGGHGGAAGGGAGRGKRGGAGAHASTRERE